MRLATKLGRHASDPLAVPPDKLALRRVAAARACRNWTEIEAARLVPQPRGRFTDSETDEVFARYPGDAFSPSAEIVADMTPLYFFVASGDVHVLERQP